MTRIPIVLLVLLVVGTGCTRGFHKSPFVSAEFATGYYHANPYLLLRGVRVLGGDVHVPTSRVSIQVDTSLPPMTAVVSGYTYIPSHLLGKAVIFVSSPAEKEAWLKKISEAREKAREETLLRIGPEKPVPVLPPE